MKKGARKARESLLREAREISEAIHALGISAQVRRIYDRAQGNGLDRFDADEIDLMSEEQREAHSHQHGIEAVWTFLVDQKIISPDTKEEVIDYAFAEVS